MVELLLQHIIAEPERLDDLGDGLLLIESSKTQEILLKEGIVTIGKRRSDPTASLDFDNERLEEGDMEWRPETLMSLVTPMSRIYCMLHADKRPFSRILIGRGAHNDMVINDPVVSTIHAFIESDANNSQFFLVDNCSKNGTRINACTIDARKPTYIEEGDCICFGRAIFYVVSKGVLSDLVSHYTV